MGDRGAARLIAAGGGTVLLATRGLRPPVRPARLGGLAAERVLQELLVPVRQGRQRLGVVDPAFMADGALWLRADLGAAAEAAPPEVAGEPGSAERAACVHRLLAALVQQHPALAAGLSAPPARHSGARDHATVLLIPDGGEEALPQLFAAVEGQALYVDLDDHQFRVPVTAVQGELPVDHVRVVVKGLPPKFARQGVLECLLRAVGYDAVSGVAVVRERGGLVVLPGLTGPLPVASLDVVCGVVVAPSTDRLLRLLPEVVAIDGWEARIRVEDQADVAPAAAPAPPVQPRPAAPAPPPRPPDLHRVYERSGLTAAAVPPARTTLTHAGGLQNRTGEGPVKWAGAGAGARLASGIWPNWGRYRED